MRLRVCALVAMVLCAAGNAWGDETVTWTASSGALGTGIGTGNITDDHSGSWSYERTLISGSSYTGWTSNCIQLGKNGGVENLTLTTSAYRSYKIKSVSVECSSYNNAHKVSIKVGSTTYLSSTATAKWTTVSAATGTGTASGDITISFTDGTRALYIKSITVVYESSSAATTTTISDSGITNTDVYTSTNAGSLSASVTSGGNAVAGATVTWSGNNDAVATINSSTGEVTLVAAGTVKFTASYAGATNQYQASSADYTMTVTNSAPSYTVTYYTNGGTGTVTDANSPYVEGSDVIVANNKFKMSGYGFVKWNTQANGQGTNYLPGDIINSIDDDIDLYAQWEELTYDFGAHTSFSSWGTAYSQQTLSYSDASVVFASANKQSSGATIEDQPVTKGGDVELKLTDGSTMSKVTFFCTQWGTNAQTITLLYSTDGGTTYEAFDPEVTSTYFTITKDNLPDGTNAVKITFSNSSKQVGVLGASITKIANTNPTLTADDVDLAYNGTSGSISYTLTNPKTGGTVTAATTSGWLSVGNPSNSNASGTVALICAANTGAERTATVTLTYTYDNKTLTKEVTVTQAANPDYVPTISEVRTQGTGSVTTKGIVTSVNGKTAYIQDNGAAIVVYDNSTDLSCTVGDEIKVSGTLSTYKGLLEITSPTINETLSMGNSVSPEVMTIAQVNASTKQGWLVKIEEATVSAISDLNVTIAQSSNTIVVRFNDASDITFAANDVITLTGNIGNYNAVQIANPTDVSVVVNTDPVITPASLSVEATATTGLSGTINVTYDNITTVEADVAFYASDGTTSATYDWITASINASNNLEYTISENTSAESRTGYLKVYALADDAQTYVYSGLITISQAGVVVDYATLPFAWNNKETTTTGVTSEGLGTYSSSPYLKFDTQGDYLILKINETPGTLSFDIKGNPSSGTTIDGTFSVLISDDGVTYSSTPLKEYENLSNTVHKESFTLPSSTRYIKWIYTTRNGGNVALGNFKLTKPVIKLNSSGYATYANVNAIDFSGTSDYTAWAVKSISDETITFEQITGAVTGGTGVLLMGEASTDANITYTTTGSDLSNNNLLVGITTATTVTADQYYGLSGDTFVKVNAGTVPAGKALLPADEVSSVKSFTFVFEDATGIKTVEHVSAELAAEIFNLAGQRMSKPVKGVNIINGKKVLVK